MKIIDDKGNVYTIRGWRPATKGESYLDYNIHVDGQAGVRVALIDHTYAREGSSWVLGVLYMPAHDPSSRNKHLQEIRETFKKVGHPDIPWLLDDITHLEAALRLCDLYFNKDAPGSERDDYCAQARFERAAEAVSKALRGGK